MAGLGIKTFGTEVLTSGQVNGYLMQQSVMTFDSDAARTSAFTAAGLSPAEGMVSYLKDTNEVQVYNGSAWIQIVNSTLESIVADSSGRVFHPYQPIFSGYRTSSLAANNAIGWSGSFINQGNMWAGAGNSFINIPVTGNYLCCIQAMSDNNTGVSFSLDLYKNGVRIPYLRAYSYLVNQGHKHCSFQVVIPFAASDYLYFVPNGTTLYGDGSGYSSCIVMLIS